MKISIIVPTFNSSATIQDNLDSVIAQKFNNYEILISIKNVKFELKFAGSKPKLPFQRRNSYSNNNLTK